MRQALATCALPYIHAIHEGGSPLIDAGFIDPDGLAEAQTRFAAGRFAVRDTELFNTLALDLALRSFT